MAVKAERQKAAVASILADGGSVIYDYQYRNGTIDPHSEPPGPAWLRRLLGDDYFTNVVWVRVSSDKGLGNISALNELQNLQVVPVSGGRPKVTDAGLKNIAGLYRLTSVFLTDCPISDAGLAELEGLSRLQFLNLGYTQVTDEGLKHLANLSQLRSLNLEHSIRWRRSCTSICARRLESLDLSRSMVTDNGLQCIEKLKSLSLWIFRLRFSTTMRWLLSFRSRCRPASSER